jgi:hypothetical protein
VHVETVGYNQHGQVVCIFRRKVMVPTKDYGEARGNGGTPGSGGVAAGGEQPGRPEPVDYDKYSR